MSADESSEPYRELRQLLRVARFETWALDKLEDEIYALFGRGVTTQPAPTPDQLSAPSLLDRGGGATVTVVSSGAS